MSKKTSYIIAAILFLVILFLISQNLMKEKGESMKEKMSGEEATQADSKEAIEVETAEETKVKKVGEIIKSIPDGGILYMNFKDLKSIFDDVSKTNFFAKFIALQAFDDLRKDIEEFNSQSAFDISFENILKVFGNDLFISIYYNGEKKKSDILMSTVLDDSVSYIAKVFNFIAQVTKEEDKETEVGKETYSDIDINYIYEKESNEYFYYLIMDDQAHFSSNIKIMKDVVDLFQGKSAKSLNASISYNKAKAKFREDNFFNMFYDFQSLDKIQEILSKKYEKANQSFDKAFPSAKNYDILLADAVAKNGIDFDATVSLKNDAKSDYLAFLSDFHGKPGKSGFSDYLRESPLFFASYNNVSIAEYYNNMKKEAQVGDQNKVQAFEESLKAVLNLSLSDDILPLFGNEMVYASTKINTDSPFFPVPDLFIGIKLSDTEKFRDVYEKVNDALVKSNPNFALQKEDYSGNIYSYVMTPLGIVPGHGIIGDYYIIFSSPGTFRKIADDVSHDSVPFFKRDVAGSIGKKVFSEYHYFSYIDSKLFLQVVPELFDKYSPILQGKMTSEERKEFLRQYNDVILPLIETFKVFDKFIWTGYYDKDEKKFMFKAHYKMEDI